MSLIASRTTLSIWSLVTDLGPRVSPAITTLLVVARVSQAARIAQGSIPAFGPSRKNRSTISSEIRSQTLSGCPSETASLVNREDARINYPLFRRTSAVLFMMCPEMSVPTARDDVGFVVEPEPVMLAQNLSGGIEGTAALSHFRQPVVLDLGDIHRRVPRCKGRRGSDRSGDLIWQRLHIIAEDRAFIGISVHVKGAPGRAELVFPRAQ